MELYNVTFCIQPSEWIVVKDKAYCPATIEMSDIKELAAFIYNLFRISSNSTYKWEYKDYEKEKSYDKIFKALLNEHKTWILPCGENSYPQIFLSNFLFNYSPPQSSQPIHLCCEPRSVLLTTNDQNERMLCLGVPDISTAQRLTAILFIIKEGPSLNPLAALGWDMELSQDVDVYGNLLKQLRTRGPMMKESKITLYKTPDHKLAVSHFEKLPLCSDKQKVNNQTFLFSIFNNYDRYKSLQGGVYRNRLLQRGGAQSEKIWQKITNRMRSGWNYVKDKVVGKANYISTEAYTVQAYLARALPLTIPDSELHGLLSKANLSIQKVISQTKNISNI